MLPIAMYRASTSRHNATVQLVCAGALISMASNLQILAQEANPIAVNRNQKKIGRVKRTHTKYSYFFRFLDEVIINAAALTSDDEDDESGDDDDDDSTEGSADNMLAF